MSLKESILLLGSDLGDREKNLIQAKTHIKKELGVITKESEIIQTEAIGFSSDLDFLNQTIQIETELSPFDLLKEIKQIEQKMGRIYGTPRANESYISRIIDIDILTYDNMNIISKKLTIPHKQVNTRSFVKNLILNLVKINK